MTVISCAEVVLDSDAWSSNCCYLDTWLMVCYIWWYIEEWCPEETSCRSPHEQKDDAHISESVAGIRDVFGDSDEDEPADYAPRNDFDQDSHVRSCTAFY